MSLSKKLSRAGLRIHRLTLCFTTTNTKWISSEHQNTSSPDSNIRLSWVIFYANVLVWKCEVLLYIFSILDKNESSWWHSRIRWQESGESLARIFTRDWKTRRIQAHVAEKWFDSISLLSANQCISDRHWGELFNLFGTKFAHIHNSVE